ncbi:MAG: helix-turn-helix domain-containing protein [Lachnospiraceae bacterium]|nr:helix-turn-helix domain-containing protein [Lachnospiraceae bacterium]
MTVNERVKKLRIESNLTLEKFGAKLGVKRSAISQIEHGVNGVTDQMIKLMVKEFGVNENWLRTGDGEMFPEFARADAIAKLADDIMTDVPDSFKSRLVTALAQMTDEQWKLLEDITYKVVGGEYPLSNKKTDLF